MRYLISYDLQRPEKDYPKLIEELRRLGAQKVLYSQWVANRANTTCVGLRDHLRGFMDSNDRLLVSTLEGSADWAGWNLMAKINDI